MSEQKDNTPGLRMLVLSIVCVGLGLGGGWLASRAMLPQDVRIKASIKPLSDGDASSPIIISDGSVNFRQRNSWRVRHAARVDAKLAGHLPYQIDWLVCGKDAQENTATCGTPPINNIALPNPGTTSWTLYLCQVAGACAMGSPSLFATLAWRATSAGGDDEDIAVDANPGAVASPPFTFAIQPTANNDGAGLRLCNSAACNAPPGLKSIGLVVNGATRNLQPCTESTTPGAKTYCTVRIAYFCPSCP